MLKQRVITACVLAVVFGAVLFFASPLYFSLFVGVVVVLSAWEWSNLSGISSLAVRAVYVVVIATLLIFSAFLHQLYGPVVAYTIFIAACVWWALTLLWVQGYPASAVVWQATWVRLCMGSMVMVPVWHALVYMHSMAQGEWLVLTLVALVAAADIGAYFTGKAIGKHKLAPNVSPGKTWEGVFGGAVFAVLLLAIIMHLSAIPVYWAFAALPTAFVSVLGDLFESMLKRHRGIKDSSNLLPGHGGVLDRVDGLVAAAPVFALALLVCDWPL